MCAEETEGSVEHILVICSSLTECRKNSFNMIQQRVDISDKTREIIITTYSKTVSDFVQLLLDCSVIPAVINACQTNESHVLNELFKFSRTWCFNVHMKRMKLLGHWRNL